MTAYPKTIGPFTILEVIDRARTDCVFLGRGASGAHVAVTVVELPSAASLAVVRREIRIVARASHPRIVELVDEGVDNGAPWFATSLVDGVGLRERSFAVKLEQDDDTPMPRVARVTAPLVTPRERRPKRIEDVPPGRVSHPALRSLCIGRCA
jgi:hypothetical protein